ncbi:hypothetical protein D3273_25340 [Lichenibacterium minor]|uniref:Uncharacterized protein n=1 Tax=Lichenibacterium minor TaxID=2316528 RepID=A0A4Q2TYK0_9HYPH|nr:hypothetical protein [Lichenibacterium minor]RYC29192.1 hypothetical protein D3273_25340 [Lichenibacterium minor]
MRSHLSPWLGHRRVVDGQVFECVAAEPVTYRSGKTRLRLRWSTRCSACGAGFRFETARKPKGAELRTLCGTHRPTRATVLRAIRYLLANVASAPDIEQETARGR